MATATLKRTKPDAFEQVTTLAAEQAAGKPKIASLDDLRATAAQDANSADAEYWGLVRSFGTGNPTDQQEVQTKCARVGRTIEKFTADVELFIKRNQQASELAKIPEMQAALVELTQKITRARECRDEIRKSHAETEREAERELTDFEGQHRDMTEKIRDARAMRADLLWSGKAAKPDVATKANEAERKLSVAQQRHAEALRLQDDSRCYTQRARDVAEREKRIISPEENAAMDATNAGMLVKVREAAEEVRLCQSQYDVLIEELLIP